jgi:hypothetical protein
MLCRRDPRSGQGAELLSCYQVPMAALAGPLADVLLRVARLAMTFPRSPGRFHRSIRWRRLSVRACLATR